MYTILFLVRFLPFWAVPAALVCFEIGMYHFNRRQRLGYVPFFGTAFFLVISCIIWLVFEGYWRAGPWVKAFLETPTPGT